MFNDSFFPTPGNVIQVMAQPYLKHTRRSSFLPDNRIVLDPSAGKGDILDYLVDLTNEQAAVRENLYSIEKEPDLQHILRKKGFNVIGNDFLQYSGELQFNLILMNPPFSNGDEHLLKAWQILEEGDIACLLNLETIRNPYTERRQFLRKLIKDHGQVTNLGAAFLTAERKTDISVALVRLHKDPKGSRFTFNFQKVTSEQHAELNEEIARNQIATRDIVGNMMTRFQKAKETYIDFLKAFDSVQFYLRGLIPTGLNAWDLLQQEFRETNQQKYNGFCDRVRERIWLDVLDKLNIEKYMTHKVRTDFKQFSQSQGMMDFTKENVQALIDLVFENREVILQRAIEEVFDLFTKYHKENRVHIEGWKTNDKWKVTQKIILPRWVSMTWDNPRDRIKYGSEYKVNWNYQSEYSDIDKVMCYLTGTRYEDCFTIYDSLEQAFRQIGKIHKGPATGKCESEFFNCTFYIKGTLHLEFKDERLWREFNMRACAGKKWLPAEEEAAWKEESRRSNCKQPAPLELFQ